MRARPNTSTGVFMTGGLIALAVWAAGLTAVIVAGCRIRLTPHKQPPGSAATRPPTAGRPHTVAEAPGPRTGASATPHQDAA